MKYKGTHTTHNTQSHQCEHKYGRRRQWRQRRIKQIKLQNNIFISNFAFRYRADVSMEGINKYIKSVQFTMSKIPRPQIRIISLQFAANIVAQLTILFVLEWHHAVHAGSLCFVCFSISNDG